MQNLKKCLLAALMILTPCVANAAGLGQITVLSALGQPFHVEIELVSVKSQELASLSAQLASRETYQRAGMDYRTAMAGLTLQIEKRPNGDPYIKIRSTRPTREFVVQFAIDLMWSTGRLIRAYTVPLDVPELDKPTRLADQSM